MNVIQANVKEIAEALVFPRGNHFFGIPVHPQTLSVDYESNRVLFSLMTRYPEAWWELNGCGTRTNGGHVLSWNFYLCVYNRIVHGELQFQER